MALEREGLERRTSRNFSQFTADVVEGNSLCRRALLHMFLRREHTGLKFEDVDFAWEEVRLEYSKQEYEAMREGLVQRLNGDDLAAALDHLDKQIAEAFDEQDVDGSGKASLPIVD
jgi:hypothetical protein